MLGLVLLVVANAVALVLGLYVYAEYQREPRLAALVANTRLS